jgi:hypothetical protein
VWVKLDDGIADHPKFFDAGRHLGRHGIARAFAVYVAGLAYANKHLTDGFLSESVVKSFKIDRKPCEIASVLSFADVGLWEPVTGGWRIHDYHHHNPKSQDVKDKREADAERKRLERAAKNANRPNGLWPESSALARARSRPDPDPVPVRPEDHAALRASDGGKPVENRRRRQLPVEAAGVLRALVWREVAALYGGDGPAPEHGDVIEHLKCTAARAGLIYGLDDFHAQAELAIARFSSGGRARDDQRNAWRAAGRPAR